MEIKSNFLNALLNDKFKPLKIKDNSTMFEMAYFNCLNDCEKQGCTQTLHLKDIVKIAKKSPHFDLFVNEFNNLNSSVIYKSHIHGMGHIERTTFLAFVLGVLSKLDKENLKLLLKCAMYHDTGRVDDSVDCLHGMRSANIIKAHNLVESEHLNLVMAAVEGHSMNDSDFNNIAKKYGVENNPQCVQLYKLLKDADALDRCRLPSASLDIKYLRTEQAKQLVMAAFELKYNYDYFVEELTKIKK